MSTLVYSTRLVALHQVRAGDRIEHDGRVYRVFRFLPMVRPHKPLGCVAIVIRQDAPGKSVALCFNDTNETVRLVCGAAVAQ